MTTEEVGAYMLLLCKSWRESPVASLPSDDLVLARWARLTPDRWSACKPAVLAPFRPGPDGRWYQKRLRLEYDKLIAVRRERKKAAKSRWNKEMNANALHKQSIPIPSSSPPLKTNTPLPPAGAGEECFFEHFGETIAFQMGRHRRPPSLKGTAGYRAADIVRFLAERGYPARIVEVA